MLYHWLYGLRHEFGPLNVFRYITFRAALCGGFSLLLCLVLGPAVIRWVKSLSLGQRIREEVPERHQAKAGTPTMGGILMLGSIVVSLLLFGDLSNHYVLIALISVVWLGLLGFADDYVKVRLGRPRGLNKRTKLIVQFALALGMRVLVSREHPQRSSDDPMTRSPDVRVFGPDQTDQMLCECDFLVLCAPVTPRTRNLINAERLARMKPEACLINVGRGALIDDAALLAALRERRLGQQNDEQQYAQQCGRRK
jgi:UDP-N-acetylmuramyl pentapeptide phosphotransferase/UDP-N-acetylglucosamine-1-phosphate transferase